MRRLARSGGKRKLAFGQDGRWLELVFETLLPKQTRLATSVKSEFVAEDSDYASGRQSARRL
jgi:hypothetical protein